jgi:hypothetical protein
MTWGRNDLRRIDLGAKRLGANRLGGETTGYRSGVLQNFARTDPDNNHVPNSRRHKTAERGKNLKEGLSARASRISKRSCTFYARERQHILCRVLLHSIIKILTRKGVRKTLWSTRGVCFSARRM